MDIRDELFWVGHASFYAKTKGRTIFIDPYMLSDKIEESADLILITHPHFDHYSKDDIDKIVKDGTRIIAPQGCEGINGYKNVRIVMPGEKMNFDGVAIETVPAYNVNKARLQNHPKANGWVGYIVDLDGKRVYHAGDTDFIPEMKEMKGLHAALLPIGGTYTMDVDEAIEAAHAINAKYTVPMHYKILLGREGSERAAKKLQAAIPSTLLFDEVQEVRYSFRE
ncbi:MAG: MBL fold metallo-hydrolase [Candidatus Marsarchaeota archaeon]|nr:MBL fold metallo-hydrolase [Candidatus Marsarchaeota archaeon]MCL5112769.1 MBL fold metallo-hydrolase [Candidatus Marsarchaeota archaeon]